MVKYRRKKSTDKLKLATSDKIVLTFNCIFSIFILFSYLSPIVDPKDFSIIAILGFAYQIFLPINLIFIIYWAVRKSRYVLVSIASILIGVTTFKMNYGFAANTPLENRREPNALRFMAFNVREFYGIDTVNEQSIQTPVAKLVDKIQPDIVSFEEYVTNTSKKDTVSALFKKVLKTGYYYFKAYGPVPKGNPGDSTGNAIISKYPIINIGFIQTSPILNIKAIFADVKIKNQIIRIYSLHLAAVQIEENEKKRYLNGKFSFLSSPIFIFDRLNAAFLIRSHQVEIIKRHIEKCPYPVIIAGDFNDTPNSYSVNKIGDGLKNSFSEKGTGFDFTYYNKFPKLHIDYIFVSPQFEVISYQAVDKKLSDHKPIVSDIKIIN